MQRNVNDLLGNNLEATDGVLGHIEDFYLDDATWTIRYLVVKTGSWLTGRTVLISRKALVRHSWGSGIFPVDLTKEQVRNSPDVDTVKPVSRQQEEELAAYYSWDPYWGSGFNAGEVWGVIPPTPVFDPNTIVDEQALKMAGEAPQLRSCRDLRSYKIQATHGEIGHVDDFIMDDETWQIAYLVVKTHLFGDKKVLIGVHHIQAVDSEDSKVMVDLSAEDIKNKAAIDEWDYIL
jgi:sporulation protein YlmC with PRC-barrel domain